MRGGTTKALAALALLFLFAAGSLSVPAVRAQTASQASSNIGQAYSAVLAAEQDGGNVTSLVVKLNSALSLVQEADLVNASDPSRAQSLYSQASAMAQQVISGAPSVAAAGKASVAAAQLDLVVQTSALGALAVVVYLYSPRIFWRYWIRAHRDWRVKKA